MSNGLRSVAVLAFVSLVFGASAFPSAPPQAAPPPDAFGTKLQPLLAKYCVKCHGAAAKPKADLNLTRFTSEAAIRENRKLWKEVLAKVYTREMPPEDAQPQPTAGERETITKFVEAALDKVDPSAPRNAGRVVARRLNRIEYRCTVRDLMGVDFNPVGDFPSDDVGYGFDNIGDVLSLPPLLMEKYLAAAKRIAEFAVASKNKDRYVFIARPKAGAAAAAGKASPAREAARECLSRLAARAFRRPVLPDELERLLKLFDVGEKMENGDFEKAMKLPLRALLISPHFLFRIEPEGLGAGDSYGLGAWEVASRLSYFLWSSMPDDDLFEQARSGRLLGPKVLEGEVARMLQDPKAFALAQNFAPQWLQVRRLEEMKFDPSKFPSWNPDLRRDMVYEVVLFFEAVMTDDLSVLTFLDADFAFVNDRLARLYGLAGGGESFRRLKLTDARRGGILTMAAVLASTSDPNRTSLVKRGKWVLETILATPPPPPVPDAANLKEDPATASLPLRERMEKHRADPNCASCHKRMDPIGFGLENYDAIGAWRDADQGKPIDPAAELPDGRRFKGPVELKNLLKERKAEFVEGFAEKMLTYGLGRGVEHYDGPAVKAIVDATAKKGYKFSALVAEVVKSYPFLNRQKDRGKK